MKIKKLEINNFRGFKNATIEFPEDNIAVLVGVNGSGKSSVLDALGINIRTILFKYITCFNFDSFDDLINASPKIRFLDKSIFSSPKFSKLAKRKLITQITYNSDNKLNHVETAILSNDVFKSSTDILDKIELSETHLNFPILTYVNGYFSKPFVLNFEPVYKQTYAYENAFSKNESNHENFFNWFKGEEDLENEIRLRENPKFINENLELVRKAIKQLLNHFPDTIFENLRIERSRKEVNGMAQNRSQEFDLTITKNKNADLKISQLSQGERSIIVLVADLARRLSLANPSLENRLEGEGVVLIDEIAQHLHPQWQRMVLPALSNTFPNLQFIVSTHSPFVAQSVGLDNLIILKNKGENIEVEYGKSNIEMSYNAIIREIFGIESIFSLEVDKDLKAFRKFRNQILNDEKIDQKAFDKLIEKLSKYGPEIESILARELKQLERLKGKALA